VGVHEREVFRVLVASVRILSSTAGELNFLKKQGGVGILLGINDERLRCSGATKSIDCWRRRQRSSPVKDAAVTRSHPELAYWPVEE
jgi:hypothetical protein